MTACLCYVNLGPDDDPVALTRRVLIEERLAAAVNIHSNVRSVYRWQDRIEEAPEVVLVVKTQEALIDRLVVRAVVLHRYQCPSVVAVPVAGGHADYLAWIEKQTG